MSTPPYPLRPEPMKKSWLEQNPYWKIPLGCLTLVSLIALFIVVLMTVITTSFRSSDVYKQALTQAASNAQVRQLIGEPLKPAWLISGQLNVSGSTGNANLSIPISGPRGKVQFARSQIRLAESGGSPTCRVGVDGQPTSIDLLSIQPPAERDF